MVYERRPQRSSYSDSSIRSSLSSSDSSTPNYIKPTPISEEEHQRWLQQLQKERETRYFNSLPIFEIEDVGDTITPENLQAILSEEKKEKKNSPKANAEATEDNLTTPDSKKAKLTKEEEEEEKKKKKKKNSWFPWLNRRESENKSKTDSKGNKPNRADNTVEGGQTANGKTPSKKTATASDKSQTDKATQTSTTATPSSNQSPSDRTLPNKTTPNQTHSLTESPTTANIPTIAAPQNQPIFVSPDLGTARSLNCLTILGKTGNGEILYTSSNPSATKTTAAENGLAVSQLPANSSNELFTQQQASAQDAISFVRTSATSSGENVSQHSEKSLSRLDGELARVNSEISHQITQQQLLIADITQRNRTKVITTTEANIALIQNKHAATITAIDNRAAAANEQLTARYQSILPKIDGVVAEFDGIVNQTLGQTEGFFAQQHQGWLTTIDNTERGYTKSFNKQSPPSSSNVIGKALEKIDRESYVDNWREAKVKATQAVANSFRESTNSSFAQHTAKLSGYRSTVMDGIQTLAQKRKQSLTAQYLQAQTEINHTASVAKAIANASLNQSIASIRQQQQQQLTSLDTVAARQNTIVAEQGATSVTTITQLGNILRGNLQTATSTAVGNFNRSASAFAEGLSVGNDAQSLAQAPAAASAAQNRIESLEYQTINEIETALTGSIAQLSEQHSLIDIGLSEIASSARMQQANSISQHQASLQQLTNSVNTGFDQQLQQSSNDINTSVSSTLTYWEYFADNLWDEFNGVNHNLSGKLNEAQNQVLAQKENFILKLGEQIRSNAEREAALVQPAWKKIVKIVVNVVITVATTVAIAALAVSGVGLVAGIGLAALIGAAGGVAKLAITDAIDGQNSSAKDYLKAAGIGAGTGVLELLGGRAVKGLAGQLGSGVLTKLEHTVVSTVVEAATNTAVELTEAIASGQDFTLALLGISVTSSLLSTAGGKYIDGAFGDIAANGGRGAVREGSQEVIEKGFKLDAAQFVTETAFDTAIETGASVARGEELTWGTFAQNASSGVMGRGAAGRADKLYGNRLRGIGRGNNHRGRTSSDLAPGEALRDRTTTPNNSDRTNPSQTPVNRERTRLGNNNSTPSTSLQRNREFEAVASGNSSNRVEVYTDPDLVGNTVQVEYGMASDGTVRGIRMRAGADATASDIELHQHTAKVMRMYGGTLGRVRVVEARLAKWLGMHGQPMPGTRAWEAQQEIPKLEKIIQNRMNRLVDANPRDAMRLEADIENLQQQLKEHRRTFERGDESDGVGYVAQRGVKRKAEEITRLREQAPTELKASLEQPPVGVLTKQEIGQWLWRTENRNAPISTMPTNLTARANTLIKEWLERGLVHVTKDGNVTFDESIRDSYDTEQASKKQKQKPEPKKSVYTDTMYGEAERITVADGWEFKTGKIISTADEIAERQIDTERANQTNPVRVDPTIFGEAASTIDDFAYDGVADKPYEYGEGRRYEVGKTVDGTVLGYKHYRQKFTEKTDVGRIGDLESGRGIDYNRLPKELIEQLKAEGIDVKGRDGVYVGEQLTKLMRGEKLPPGKSSQTITELYGLLFAKEPSHPWRFNIKTGKSEATYRHQRDLIYSKMITQLMASGKIETLQEALDLHPATYGGAQKGAKKVTDEMDGKRIPEDETYAREDRDERYRREKETIQKWFEMYEQQLIENGQEPTLENLEKFIEENL